MINTIEILLYHWYREGITSHTELNNRLYGRIGERLSSNLIAFSIWESARYYGTQEEMYPLHFTE